MSRDDAVTPEHDADRPDTIRAAIGDDLSKATTGQRILLVIALAWIAYEWGVGNETVTPWLLFSVIDRTDGWGVVPAVAATGFVFVFVEQLLAGWSTLYGFEAFDRTARALWRRLTWFADAVQWSTLGFFGRLVMVFTLGTPAVVVIQRFADPDATVAERRHVVAVGAAMAAGAAAVLGAVAAALAEVGRRSDRYRDTAENIVSFAANPLLWLGIATLFIAVRIWRRPR